ncbi:MAG TPA: hypothetical protein VKM72_23135 [Thermoanaerobaculia bacterium]|nr:hypothetical protein [Thermoanaerobaculia bacterium]
MKRIDFALSRLFAVAFCGLALAIGTSCQRVALPEAPVTGQNPQKQTVADIRNTGTAMFSWLTDQVGAAAAGQSQVPPPVDLADYASISHADLTTILVPSYMQEVPELDGWNSPYEYYLNVDNHLAPKVMSIRSPGRDRVFSGTVYTVGPFDPESLDEDLVWADGFFVRWPQKK